MRSHARLVVAGHCTIDDIHLADGRELPETFGGAAAYASLGASIVGADVTLLTLVGDDYPLDRLRDGLCAVGEVDTTHVRTVSGRSVHNQAWYELDGGRRFEIESWERMELLTPCPADLPPHDDQSPVLLAAASLWQQCALADELFGICPIALDTELHYIDRPDLRRELLELAGRVDYFFPSIEHLRVLFGSRPEGPPAYADELSNLGCPIVAVKQGAGGSVVFDLDRSEVWQVPPVSGVTVADTTGAGDGYDGGFLAARAHGCDPVDAGCWGTVAASYVVETIGATVPSHFSVEAAKRRFESVQANAERLQSCHLVKESH